MTQNSSIVERSLVERSKVTFLAGIATSAGWLEWWKQKSAKVAPIGVAMMGRSNVGKSTLINLLFRKGIARSSKTPGKTKEINIFQFELTSNPGQFFYVYDLPGHGHAEVSKEQKRKWDELLEAFFASVPAWTLGVEIRDARHLETPSDEAFEEFMKYLPMELVMVANKIDALKNQKEKNEFRKNYEMIMTNSRWKSVFQCSQDHQALQNSLAQYINHFCLRRLMAQGHHQSET
jgi:GTP-binding protein